MTQTRYGKVEQITLWGTIRLIITPMKLRFMPKKK